MNDDALKVVVFGGALVAVYLIARFARGVSDQASTISSFTAEGLESLEIEPMERPRGLVGSEIPFPFDVRELEAKYGADVWRPIVLNYFFREIDLTEGPRDPEDFYDEFFVEWEHPENGYRWRTSLQVTTLKGMARLMTEERASYHFGDGTLIVRRFDLSIILRAVMENMIEANDPRLENGGSNSSAAADK